MSETMKTRVILVSGKGGVGKTTVAAATGIAAAARGEKTLVMSFDLAHSLADAFDLEEAIFSDKLGSVIPINGQLDLQEINLQAELDQHWGDTYQLLTGLLYGGGRLSGIGADEIGLMPGMEDLIALTCLQRWVEQEHYDLIVVDCPPTAETLGFVGFTAILQWYVTKRLPFDRSVARTIRPFALAVDPEMEMFLPEDHHFEVFKNHAAQLDALDRTLRDTQRTSVRLVANPEKMVIHETKRALVYFSMYGMNIDAVIVNRVLPEQETYLSSRVAAQQQYLKELATDFDPLPIFLAKWQPREMVGVAALEAFATDLYPGHNPAAVFIETQAFNLQKIQEDRYQLDLHLPFVSKEEVDLRRHGQTLSVRIGQFKRNLVLPRRVAALPTREAKLRDCHLTVLFAKAEA